MIKWLLIVSLNSFSFGMMSIPSFNCVYVDLLQKFLVIIFFCWQWQDLERRREELEQLLLVERVDGVWDNFCTSRPRITLLFQLPEAWIASLAIPPMSLYCCTLSLFHYFHVLLSCLLGIKYLTGVYFFLYNCIVNEACIALSWLFG